MNIEQQYLSLCKEIIEKGNIEQETRSGQTRSLFGRELNFNNN